MKAGIALSVTLALVLAAAANGALPTIHNTLIVPGKSVGAVKLCDTEAQVAAAWGGMPEQNSEAVFASRTKGSANVNFNYCLTKQQKQRAEHLTPGPEATRVLEEQPIGVNSVTLSVGFVHGAENYNTPLTRFKTARGIGLGSTVKQISRAYPHLRATRGPAQKASGTLWYAIAGSNAYGSTETVFDVHRGRVFEIITRGEP